MKTETAISVEIFHGEYNLHKKDNLDELPSEKAIFGIFAIVNDAPANCRYVDVTDNLQSAVRELYENPPGEGMRNFMQGPWYQVLLYELLTDTEQTESIQESWIARYSPKIDADGEYPGYYD